jgi:hypothetical protein
MVFSWSKIDDSNVKSDICSKFYSDLVESWLVWGECRRLYKWFSVLLLLIAYAFGVTGIILYRIGHYCCWGSMTSESESKSNNSCLEDSKELETWHQKASIASPPINEWNCLLLNSFRNFIGFIFLFLGAITILLCYLVLFLSFVPCYEVRNDKVEILYYVLDFDWLKSQGNLDAIYPGLQFPVYSRMDRKPWCQNGAIQVKPSTILLGQNVYTGWIKLRSLERMHEDRINDLEEQNLNPAWLEESSPGNVMSPQSNDERQPNEKWIYCNSRTSQMMFKSFRLRGDAQFYINLYSSIENQTSLTSEVSPFVNDNSIPVANAIPIIPVDNTFITPSSIVLSSSNK